MARPPLPVGAWGRVARADLGDGRWRATARVRDLDGVTRQVFAFDRTGAAAERALLVKLRDRVAPAGEELTPETLATRLGEAYLDELAAAARVSPQTLERYATIVSGHINPALGGLRLREVTPGRVDRFLRALAERAPVQAQRAKTVLGQMCTLAVRHDALRTNPVRDVGPLPRPARADVRTLTLDDLAAVRAAVRQWRTVTDEDGHRPVGPRPTDLLADVVDLQLGTGLRIGEVLAVRWRDIDLGAARPTLTVTGTLVHVKSQGLHRQPAPKTAAAMRTVCLPRFVVEVLLRRRVTQASNPHGAVFTTRKGTWVAPGNVRRQWRACRLGTGLEWVTPHVFRKTVATLVERERGLDSAAEQLGHAGSGVTAKHYIEMRPAVAPDLADVLEQLGPGLNACSTETPTSSNYR